MSGLFERFAISAATALARFTGFTAVQQRWRSFRRRRTPATQPPDAGAVFRSGQAIGRYVVERELGRGAAGVVLLARDARSGEPLALKTLALSAETRAAGVDPNAANASRDRFFHAARLARRLRHPGIAAVQDAGVDRGIAYLAMELAPGCDLTAAADPSRLLPAPQVLAIGAAVAQALAYAHREGVVHRDLKPSNIVFDAATGSVKLTDFGVARAMDDAADGVEATRSGLLLGTIAFMAPEQLAGAPVGPASDFYALGTTVFLLLTGRLPHEADSMSQQMHAIVNRTAPDLRTLRPDLPPALAATLARLLAKAPSTRLHAGADTGEALAIEWRRLAAEIGTAAAPGAASPAGLSGALPAAANEAPDDPRHNSGPSSSSTARGGPDPYR